jgi:transposase
MDVHKKKISIAIADAERDHPVRSYGCITNDLESLNKFIRKIGVKAHQLHFVYEAGPCGYVIYRHLRAKGFDCMVTAPSMIPKKSSERIKTDRRDARKLASLHRAGELTAVYVPEEQDEAMRDLTRCREDACIVARKAKQRLNAFLLRHGFVFPGKKHWTQAHLNWIADITMAYPTQQLVLDEYLHALKEASQRVERLTDQIRMALAQWRMAPVVQAMQACRGVSLIVAVTTVAEIGDLGRFDNAQQLMAYLGLVPSEYSSGEHIKRGGITKTGNGHVRRMLVEAAWAYRMPARRSRYLLKRQQHLPDEVCAIAWKAQLRLCARFRQMRGRGKPKQVVATAIARELSAFLWAIAKELPTPV